MYHSVGTSRLDDSYGLTVSKELFHEQISFLESLDGSFISVNSGLERIDSLEKPTFGITFDDGYKDNLIASEILINKSVPFSIYCIADKIGLPDYLSSQDLRDLCATGLCTIGGHGLTHKRLGDLDEANQVYELRRCREILEQALGVPVQTMSLPHGSLSSRTLEFAKSSGYQLICTSRPGINTPRNFDPFHIRRTEIRSFDNLDSFIKKVNGADDWRKTVYLGKSFLSWIVDAQWNRFD